MVVYVIVPNWNGRELLGPCLESLIKQSHPASIVVVDNGSDDGSGEYVKQQFPDVTLIPLPSNAGFAGGVNTGIKHALDNHADAVALLNNDAVAEPNWLEELVKTMTTSVDAGVVTSKILLTDKKHLDSTGDFYTIWGLPFPRGRNEIDDGQYDNQTSVFSASGGASLYRAKTLQEIGLFDEDFFAYFEDVDISFRARLAGWDVRYEPKAIVFHLLNATSSRLGGFSLFHSSKNFILLYVKNMPGWLYFKYAPLVLLQLARWFLTSLLRGKLLTFLHGIVRAHVLLPKTLSKRRRVQSARKLTTHQVEQLLTKHRPPKLKSLEPSHE